MKKIEINYVQSGLSESERLEAIAQILAGGIYQYLKREGVFLEDRDRGRQAENLVRDCQKLLDNIE